MSDLEIVFCDVGQGDASTIKLADGSYILIDAGPNAKNGNPISRWFAEHPEAIVRKVVITHNHRDHFGGLISLLESGRNIEEVLMMPDKALYEDPVKKDFLFLRQSIEQRVAAGTLVRTWFSGAPYEIFSDENFRLRALRPNKLPIPATQDQNVSSMVIQLERVDNPGVPIVAWGGDALLKDVCECLSSGPRVLMGPHHGAPQDGFGSGKECAKLLKSVCPACLYISVGTINGHQHPQKYYLFSAAALGAVVCCSEITPRCGKYCHVVGDVYPGNLMLGIRKPPGAVECRGSMRVMVSPSLGLRFDEFQSEFLDAVKEIENRYCKNH